MSAVSTAKTPMDLKKVHDLIHDGIKNQNVEAILSNLYWQNQKMEKEMAEFRAAAMVQRETVKKTDKVVAKLESRINEQESKMAIMTQEIRKFKTNLNEKETILKQVLHEEKKCVDELESAKQSIRHIEKMVNIELTHEKIETIFQNRKKVNFSQNKTTESSFRERTNDLDKNTSMSTGINVSMSEIQRVNNITPLRTGNNRFSKGDKSISKQLKNSEGVLPKRDIINSAAEGVAFSAYLDHVIQHMGSGHTIKCNQIILNDGNHYSSFTGIFTVPQTGVYLLTFNFSAEHANDWTQVRLKVNNRETVDAAAQVTGSLQRVSAGNTAIIKLNQGEYVWLESQVDDSEVMKGSHYRWTTFSGVLLY